MKKYYVITAQDLSEQKQLEIKEDITSYLVENNYPVDLIDDMVARAWCELEIDIGGETSEDKWRTDAYVEGGDI